MTGKILIVVSLLMLAVGIFFGYSSYSFVSSSVKTEARVKNIIKGHRRITPVFEYIVNGKSYEYEGAATNYDAYVIGDKEVVYYKASDPNDSKTGTFMNLWFLPVFLGGFGLILLPVGIGTTFFNKRKSPAFTIKRPGSI
ncbi:MAG: DUF3592 domain-containing protein [Ignavibacteria bacterium]